MGANTSISWTDSTWSPLRGRVRENAAEIARQMGYTSLIQIGEKMAGHVGQHCEHVSSGCKNCYSGTIQARCLPVNGTGLPFDRRSRDLIEPFVDETILVQPLHWRKERRIFVENQSDLFGEWHPDEFIDRVFAVMALCPQHIFQVLTKRAERMLAYLKRGRPEQLGAEIKWPSVDRDNLDRAWPLPNVHLGISCEDQETADARIPLLLRTPAAKRFVSYEPALGPVDFEKWTESGLECECGWRGVESQCAEAGPEDDPGFACPKCGEIAAHLPLNEKLDQIIFGGESGPGARATDIQWARNTTEQCRAAGIGCFVKQLGAKPFVRDRFSLRFPGNPSFTIMSMSEPQIYPRQLVGLKDRKGASMEEWPNELRVQEFV